jgi:hypothetical protein
LAKLAKLSLDFTINNTLDPRITFSRTSNATLVGPDGLIQYAPHNLLTYSEQFDNAVWTKTSVTASPNITTAPDGTTTADTVVYSGASVTPSQTITSATTTYTISTYVKSSNTSFCRLRVSAVGGGSTSFSSYFNIATGVVSSTGVATADFGSLLPSITSVGNGWYRISVTFTVLSAVTSNIYGIVAAQTSGGASSAGDELYIWGAQLNEGALQPYYSTTVKNLLGYSQNFDNAAWTKNNITVSADVTIAPDGNTTADKLVESTANGSHYIRQFPSITSSVTYSVYAKAAERSKFQLDLFDSTNGTRNALFNLTNGTVEAIVGTGVVASITLTNNGWHRCSVTVPSSASGGDCKIALYTTSNSYIGDGTSGIYIFGAQLSDSASLDPYSYNPVAAPTSTAYYGPRFDYDPATLAPKGLLIEEQRTNLLICSIPNLAIPTGWSVGIGGGTFTHTLVTAPSQFLGFQSFILQDQVTSGRGFLTTSITLSASTTYTLTCYFDTTNTYVTSGSPTIVFIGGLADATGTLSASVSSIDSTGKVSITFTTGTSIAATIRVGIGASNTAVGRASYSAWQLEAGAFPTSYIPTTSATVTRAADNASMVGSNFSSWYNQSEGTMYSQWMLGGDNISANVYNINDTTSANYIRNRYNSAGSGNDNAVAVSNIVQLALAATNQIALYAMYKNAMSYKQNDFARSANGTLITGSTGNIPVVSQMIIGGVVGDYLNGHIQSIKYYPTRLPNGTLQGLTA